MKYRSSSFLSSSSKIPYSSCWILKISCCCWMIVKMVHNFFFHSTTALSPEISNNIMRFSTNWIFLCAIRRGALELSIWLLLPKSHSKLRFPINPGSFAEFTEHARSLELSYWFRCRNLSGERAWMLIFCFIGFSSFVFFSFLESFAFYHQCSTLDAVSFHQISW